VNFFLRTALLSKEVVGFFHGLVQSQEHIESSNHINPRNQKPTQCLFPVTRQILVAETNKAAGDDKHEKFVKQTQLVLPFILIRLREKKINEVQSSCGDHHYHLNKGILRYNKDKNAKN